MRTLPGFRLLLLSLALGLSTSCDREPKSPPAKPVTTAVAVPTSESPLAPPEYVGVSTCRSCHEGEAKSWTSSHHDLAIQVANEGSVLGDFDNATFRYFGTVSRFKKTADQYLVETEGKTYKVKYAFGVEPLQQYLVDVGQGHLQTLPMAFDTRSKKDGGQRWYHLYPDEHIKVGDPLHWLGPAQNWNHVCADCHSTNLQKNYQPKSQEYKTEFSELNVGCESCHGPGSHHVAEAKKRTGATGKWTDSKGLPWSFTKQIDRRWQFLEGRPIAQLVGGPQSSKPDPKLAAEGKRQILRCAKCHSRRGDFGGASSDFHDRYRLELLGDVTYFADGQIKDEVYVVGSFIQSKMHAAGVICSDCHDPHTAAVRTGGNQLCGGCHNASVFDTAQHHFHAAGAPGSQCTDCHMPTRTYMGVDVRHDHQFSIPRPDLTLELGVPNACTTQCHQKGGPEASARWARDELKKRFGAQQRPTFARALSAAWKLAPGGDQLLEAVIKDKSVSAMARASALLELRSYPAYDSALLGSQAKDASPLVRRALATLAGGWAPARRAPVLRGLLRDPVRTVRLEAFRGLLEADRSGWKKADLANFSRVRQEFLEALSFNVDRPGALLDLARLELLKTRGDAAPNAKAEGFFRRALALDPAFTGAYINFADYYRATGRDADAEVILKSGLKKAGDPAQLEHALGLTLIRLKRTDVALPHLGRAYELRPDLPRLGFVYAVALHESGRPKQAIEVLEAVHARFRGEQDVLAALVQYHLLSGNQKRAAELRAGQAR